MRRSTSTFGQRRRNRYKISGIQYIAMLAYAATRIDSSCCSRTVSCCPAERFYSLRIGENRLFCQSTNPLPAFLRQKIPDSAQKCQIGDLVFSCIYSPIIFANNTISGMAMMVLSRKITSSFQKFNGISLLINAGAGTFC